jgi:hypothetical protein
MPAEARAETGAFQPKRDLGFVKASSQPSGAGHFQERDHISMMMMKID